MDDLCEDSVIRSYIYLCVTPWSNSNEREKRKCVLVCVTERGRERNGKIQIEIGREGRVDGRK